jgi:hypothetical protein
MPFPQLYQLVGTAVSVRGALVVVRRLALRIMKETCVMAQVNLAELR